MFVFFLLTIKICCREKKDFSFIFLGCGFLHFPDLFDEVGLLIVELLVVRAILLEVAQEVD